MGISDLLMMLKGGVDAAPQPGGVAQMLGSTSPDAMMTNQPLPQESGMGMLASPDANAAVAQPPAQPVTPPSDAGAGGLSDFLSRMVDKATTANPDTGMNFIDRLGKFGGQITDMTGDTRGAAAGFQAVGDQRMADARRAQLNQMADHLGMSPREKLIFLADPEKWTEANAKGLEPATVAGGATRVEPGKAPYTAPLVGQENGEGYSATPSGITDTGSLAVSPQQKVADDVKRAQEAAMARYHEMMLEIQKQNADANTYRAHKAPAGGAAATGLPPGYVPR